MRAASDGARRTLEHLEAGQAYGVRSYVAAFSLPRVAGVHAQMTAGYCLCVRYTCGARAQARPTADRQSPLSGGPQCLRTGKDC